MSDITNYLVALIVILVANQTLLYLTLRTYRSRLGQAQLNAAKALTQALTADASVQALCRHLNVTIVMEGPFVLKNGHDHTSQVQQ